MSMPGCGDDPATVAKGHMTSSELKQRPATGGIARHYEMWLACTSLWKFMSRPAAK
jgi:hypothetical protein